MRSTAKPNRLVIAKTQRVAHLEPAALTPTDELDRPVELVLAECAAAANEAHHACENAARAATQYAVNAGHALLRAKLQVMHGKWIPWLIENFEGSLRTAQTYMQIARRYPSGEVGDVSMREAIRQLHDSDKDDRRAAALDRSLDSNLWATAMQLREFNRTSITAYPKLHAQMVELRDLLNKLLDS
jgi:hypothetical protein